ncbi:hypothetical protein [Niallia sp. Krafla_26]|uniref:hypothetical protein n=1 Tax=Niallia sp. Krafla_26 TaxID=3064703 RepID=UPI003D17E8CD
MTGRNVYILLTDTGTLFTRLIKLYTKKPYNHASISFDSMLTEVYSFGRKVEWNPFIGGFVKEDIRKGLFKQADCAIYSLKVNEEQLQKMNDYIEELKTQREEYRYNLFGLLGFLFNKPIQRSKAFFCSQFVATLLKECNVLDIEKSPALIAPNDLQKMPKCQFVYEGKLRKYHNETEQVSVCLIPVKM